VNEAIDYIEFHAKRGALTYPEDVFILIGEISRLNSLLSDRDAEIASWKSQVLEQEEALRVKDAALQLQDEVNNDILQYGRQNFDYQKFIAAAAAVNKALNAGKEKP
jgi:hypothetical protein